MADQLVKQEALSPDPTWYVVFRLVETLLAAGWSVVEMSDGTSIYTFDNWTAKFGSLGSESWIIIESFNGHHICFKRDAENDHDGWILWSKGGNFTTGGNTTRPLIPSDVAEIRGTVDAGSDSFITPRQFLGGSTDQDFDEVSIGARDATGSGDESFWLVAKASGVEYTESTSTHGKLAFEALEGGTASDPVPYAWWSADNNVSSWSHSLDDLRFMVGPESQGYWHKWWSEGANESFESYGGCNYYCGDQFSAHQTGETPPWQNADDEYIYAATPVLALRRVNLQLQSGDAEGSKDPNGGWTKNILFQSNQDDPVSLDTFDSGQWKKFGNYLVVWWDGTTGDSDHDAKVQPLPPSDIIVDVDTPRPRSGWSSMRPVPEGPPDPKFFQRIYDTVLKQYVYYTISTVTDAPGSSDTVPNHSGTLESQTHEIIDTL